jgi:glycosyltransferase involved in cell wall biosynthesis
MIAGRFRAFFSGIYSAGSRLRFRRLLERECPDLVHIQNLFPLISPAILPECARLSIPVVMTVQNFRLICPNGLLYRHGNACHRCVGGREYWCVLRDCQDGVLKSLGYALRSSWARCARYYLNNVSVFACVTNFQRSVLVKGGLPPERLVVIPSFVSGELAEQSHAALGDIVGYAGRVSPEKGIGTLLGAAKLCPDINFEVAGHAAQMPDARRTAPVNVSFVGHLDPTELRRFYGRCRIVVAPSVCFEAFGLIVAEAMLQARAVVASRIGGLPEVVDDGKTGLLFEPANAADMAEKVRYLWRRPVLCEKMGLAGLEKARREYSPETYYDRLMSVYESVMGPRRRVRPSARLVG